MLLGISAEVVKEIENYLIIPSAIERLIREESAHRYSPDLETIIAEIDRITTSLYDQIFDAMAHDYISDDRARGVPGANERARERLKIAWTDFEGMIDSNSLTGFLLPKIIQDNTDYTIIKRWTDWLAQKFPHKETISPPSTKS